jgi:hypothetical protein
VKKKKEEKNMFNAGDQKYTKHGRQLAYSGSRNCKAVHLSVVVYLMVISNFDDCWIGSGNLMCKAEPKAGWRSAKWNYTTHKRENVILKKNT